MRFFFPPWFIAGIVLLVSMTVSAQDVSPPVDPVASPSPSQLITNNPTPGSYSTNPSPQLTGRASEGFLPIIFYFFLLLAVIVAGFYLSRNGFAFFQPKSKDGRKLIISETRMLGNRQFLVVAEYEGKKMLLGVCPGRIDYLTPLSVTTDPETFSATLERKEEKT